MQQCINILGTALITLAVLSPAYGQSLGDVAKKSESRKAKPAKVYTNDDLPQVEAPVTPPAPAPPAATTPASGAGQPPAAEKPADGPKKDEAYWRARVAEIRDNLQRARMFQEALQTRINSLSADFTSRDDPAQRGVVASDRQKALAELERVKKEIKDFEKALSDLEDEARRAGVPPGWLR